MFADVFARRYSLDVRERREIFGAIQMKTLEEKKKDRFKFLEKLCEKKDSGSLQIFEAGKISQEIGLQEAEADLIVEYLKGESLIKTHDDGGSLISITHSGILEVEQAISEPNKPTEHFPPIFNFISIEQMNNSQIQQGSAGSNQTYNLTKHNRHLESKLNFDGCSSSVGGCHS